MIKNIKIKKHKIRKNHRQLFWNKVNVIMLDSICKNDLYFYKLILKTILKKSITWMLLSKMNDIFWWTETWHGESKLHGEIDCRVFILHPHVEQRVCYF